MPTDNLTILAFSLLAGCLPALIVLAAALRLRSILGRRLQRLEDALRVYNGANAELGRQLREMEEQFRIPVPRSAAVRGTEPPRATGATLGATLRAPEPARAAEPLRSAVTPAARRPSASGDAEFTDAELKLARLLKSRLPAMRAG